MVNHRFKIDDWVLTDVHARGGDLEKVTVVLAIEGTARDALLQHNQSWVLSSSICPTSKEATFVAQLRGSLLTTDVLHQNIRTAHSRPVGGKALPAAHDELYIRSQVSSIIRHNQNFFARSGAPRFSGVLYSERWNCRFHPALDHVQTFRLLQAALSQKSRINAPLIHVHKMGALPRTKRDAGYVQYFVSEHQTGFPGAKTRIVLYRGEPYVLSVISTDAKHHIANTRRILRKRDYYCTTDRQSA